MHCANPRLRRRTVRRATVVCATVVAAISVGSVSPGSSTTGPVSIAVPAAGATNRLTLGASGTVAGDSLQRAVDLENTGTQNLGSVTLTTTGAPSSALDTDPTNGLQLAIDRCSQAWTESGASPAFAYTCGGTTSGVLASRPVIGSGLTLNNLTALTAGNTDHLRVIVTLPATAGNVAQSQTSAITYAFTGSEAIAPGPKPGTNPGASTAAAVPAMPRFTG